MKIFYLIIFNNDLTKSTWTISILAMCNINIELHFYLIKSKFVILSPGLDEEEVPSL